MSSSTSNSRKRMAEAMDNSEDEEEIDFKIEKILKYKFVSFLSKLLIFVPF